MCIYKFEQCTTPILKENRKKNAYSSIRICKFKIIQFWKFTNLFGLPDGSTIHYCWLTRSIPLWNIFHKFIDKGYRSVAWLDTIEKVVTIKRSNHNVRIAKNQRSRNISAYPAIRLQVALGTWYREKKDNTSSKKHLQRGSTKKNEISCWQSPAKV